MRAFVPWSEWPASTDSQNEAEVREVRVDMVMGVRVGEVMERCSDEDGRVSGN
jgi:hypothetical protein